MLPATFADDASSGIILPLKIFFLFFYFIWKLYIKVHDTHRITEIYKGNTSIPLFEIHTLAYKFYFAYFPSLFSTINELVNNWSSKSDIRFCSSSFPFDYLHLVSVP